MKKFALIVLGGTLTFVGIAIIQEWPVFSAWLGLRPPAAAPKVSPEQRAQAVATLQQFHSMLAHLYRARGDARFAERLPASDGLGQEILDDLAYLQRSGREQELSLLDAQVDDVLLAGEGRLEVDTRERWQVRIYVAGPERKLESESVEMLHARYRLDRRGEAFKVLDWERLPPDDAEPASVPTSAPASARTASPAPSAD